LGADPDQAVTQATLERAEALPLEPVNGVAGRMRLRDHVAGELASPLIVMTLAAGEIQLALTPVERGPAAIEERLRPGVGGDVDRHSARLAGDGRGAREQAGEFVS